MPPTIHASLVFASFLIAQPLLAEDRPAVHVPARPVTRQELDHLEALQSYARAAVEERLGHTEEALRLYEAAQRLDPDSTAIKRGLITLYLGLDRVEDAMIACRRVLELDPADYVTGYTYARQLRLKDRPKEALAVLKQVAAIPEMKDRVDMQLQVQYDLGMLLEDAGDLPQAESAYRKVTALLDNRDAVVDQTSYSEEDIQGQTAEVYERVGRVALKLGKVDRAIADFQQVRKNDPARGPRLALQMSEELIKLKKPREALGQLDEYLRSQPQGMEGYETKITLLRQLDRGRDIVPELEAAAERDHHNTALKLLLARECAKDKKVQRAEAIYQTLAAESPSAEVYAGLFALRKAEKPDGPAKALTMLNDVLAASDDEKDTAAAAKARAMLSALRDDPEMVQEMLKVIRQWLAQEKKMARQLNFVFANLALRTGKLDTAEGLYRSLYKEGNMPPGSEAIVYDGLIRVLLIEHKYEEAVKVCKTGLEKAEATNRALFQQRMSHAYLGMRKTKEAQAAADEAVNISGEKDRLGCRLDRALVFAQCDAKDKAVAECQALLKEYNQPGETRDIRYTFSGVYATLGEHEKSEEQLKLILDDDSNDASACNDLGYVWADQGKNLQEAERLIRKALEQDRKSRTEGPGVKLDADQDNAAYVDSLGWVLFRLGKLPEARRELERATKLGGISDDPVVWDHLGDVCFRMGDKKTAGSSWKKALELYEAGSRRNQKKQVEDLKEKVRLLEK